MLIICAIDEEKVPQEALPTEAPPAQAPVGQAELPRPVPEAPVVPAAPVVAPQIVSRPSRSLKELVEEYGSVPKEEREGVQKQINANPGGPKRLLNELAGLYREEASLRDSIIEIIYDAPHTGFSTIRNLAAVAFSNRKVESLKAEAEYHIALALMGPPGKDLEDNITSRMLSESKWGGGQDPKEFETIVSASSRLSPYLLYLQNPEHPPAGSKPIAQDIMDRFDNDDDRIWEQYKLDHWKNENDRVEKAKDRMFETLKTLQSQGVLVPEKLVKPDYTRQKTLAIAKQILPVDKNYNEKMMKDLSKYIYDKKLTRIPKVWKTTREKGRSEYGEEDLRWLPIIDQYLRENGLSLEQSEGQEVTISRLLNPEIPLPQSQRKYRIDKRRITEKDIQDAKKEGYFPNTYLDWLFEKWRKEKIPDFYDWLEAKLKREQDAGTLAGGEPIRTEDIRGVRMDEHWLDFATESISKALDSKSPTGSAERPWEDPGDQDWLTPEMFGKGVVKSQIPLVRQFMRRRNVSLNAPIGEEGETSLEISQEDLPESKRREWLSESPSEAREVIAPESRSMEWKYDPMALVSLLGEEEQEAAKRFRKYITPTYDSQTSRTSLSFKNIVRYIVDQLYLSENYPPQSEERRVQIILSTIGRSYANLKATNIPQSPQKDMSPDELSRMAIEQQGKAAVNEYNDELSLKAFRDLAPLLNRPIKLRHSADNIHYDAAGRYGLCQREVMLDILEYVSDKENQAVLVNKFGLPAAVHAMAAARIIRTAVFVLISNRFLKLG